MNTVVKLTFDPNKRKHKDLINCLVLSKKENTYDKLR